MAEESKKKGEDKILDDDYENDLVVVDYKLLSGDTPDALSKEVTAWVNKKDIWQPYGNPFQSGIDGKFYQAVTVGDYLEE